MRTTIRLEEQLLLRTKQLALQTGRTLTTVIEDALREMFARREQSTQSETIRLITVQGQGIQPGVDLDDSAALLDLMEDFNAAV